MSVFHILSWVAVGILSVSYWFQIWKIHLHKEVRDISLLYHLFLAVGFGFLAISAYEEGSTLFFVKQIATTIPVIVIVGQILYHKGDRWHDISSNVCSSCALSLESNWLFCPACGLKKEEQLNGTV